MLLADDKKYLTIAETARLWDDLSPNLTAKIHQWLARKIFLPECYEAPRKRKACRLSPSDVVTVALLHWCFHVGTQFGHLLQGGFEESSVLSDEDRAYGRRKLKEPMIDGDAFLAQSFRGVQLCLEHHDFYLYLHLFPCTTRDISIGPPNKRVAIINFPQWKPGTVYYRQFLVPTAKLRDHLKLYEPDFKLVPSTLIDVRAIFEEYERRLAKLDT